MLSGPLIYNVGPKLRLDGHVPGSESVDDDRKEKCDRDHNSAEVLLYEVLHVAGVVVIYNHRSGSEATQRLRIH